MYKIVCIASQLTFLLWNIVVLMCSDQDICSLPSSGIVGLAQ